MELLAVILIVVAAAALVGRRAVRSARSITAPSDARGLACGGCCDPCPTGEEIPGGRTGEGAPDRKGQSIPSTEGSGGE